MRQKEHPSVHGEWILQLDADEELHFTTKEQIKNEMSDNAVDGINVVIRNLQPEGDMLDYFDEQQVRLFKNKSEYRFQNRINEQIVSSIAEMGGTFSQTYSTSRGDVHPVVGKF